MDATHETSERGTSELLTRTLWTARSTGTNEAGVWVIGPVLVEIVTTQLTRPDGTECTPSYYVSIDGRHAFGGFASHLSESGLPPVGSLRDFSPRTCEHENESERSTGGERTCESCGLVLESFLVPPAVWVPSTGEVFLARELPHYVRELRESHTYSESYSSVPMAVAVATEWYADN